MAGRAAIAGRAATAVHDYTDDVRPNTITFTTGQRVTDIECHPGPMWYGSANGSSGWFHRNHVLLDELAFTDQQLANMNALSRDLCMPYHCGRQIAFHFPGYGTRRFAAFCKSPRWNESLKDSGTPHALWQHATAHYKSASNAMVHTAMSELKCGRRIVYATYKSRQFYTCRTGTIKTVKCGKCILADGTTIDVTSTIYIILA